MAADSPGTQSSLSEFATAVSATEDSHPPLPDRVEEPTERQQQQLIERANAHARTVDLDVDLDAIEWVISTNAQRTRRAGDCRYNKMTEQVTIRFCPVP